MKKCEDCRYFLQFDWEKTENGDLDTGECRRYPPSFVDKEACLERGFCFPDVFNHDWCGEFKEKEEENKKPAGD